MRKTTDLAAPSTSNDIRLVQITDSELTLRVQCRAGYQSAFLKLWPDRFDAGTLDIEMDEFPSGKTVLSRGWDLHQFEPRMAVPVFAAFLNGRDLGDVWFDVPHYLDHRRGVLDTEFGFRVDMDDEVELRLVIPKIDRGRLRWNMLERLEIGPDERTEVSLPPLKKSRHDRPWLFLNGQTVKQVQSAFKRMPQLAEPLAFLEEVLEDYDGIPPENVKNYKPRKGRRNPPAYVPIPQIAAGAALVTGAPEWIAIARRCLRQLCCRPSWSQSKNPRVMGGDNDMPVGHPLLGISMIVNYLNEYLDEEERAMAVAKAREYTRKLYDFSVLQKRYHTGLGHITSHETCTLLGLAAACMVFRPELPEESDRWLAWAHGRMLCGLRAAPAEGRHSWPTYGPQFMVSYAAAVHDYAGVNLFEEPFLKAIPFALWREIDTLPTYELDRHCRWIFAACSTYSGVPEAKAGWHRLWKAQSEYSGDEHVAGWQDMLWHPRDGGREPERGASKSFLYADTGLALMSTSESPARLACRYQSGVAVGRAGFHTRTRYGMELHDANADGGIMILVDGFPVVAPAPSPYRRGFALQSVVTVNGAGHYMDGRVLGVRPEESWLSKITSFKDSVSKTVATGENTGAYREELGVTQSRRRVALDKRRQTITVEDSISLAKPQRIAARFQCTGYIEKVAPGHYRFHSETPSAYIGPAFANEPRQTLELFVADADKYRIHIRKAQMVLPYSYGFNIKKGKTAASLSTAAPPRPQYLEIAVPGQVTAADFQVRFELTRSKTSTQS